MYERRREGGKAVGSRSQDIGLAVLVAVVVAAVCDRRAITDFSVKEKDEASLSNGFRQDSLNAFILRFAGVKAFLFGVPSSGGPALPAKAGTPSPFSPRWSLNRKTAPLFLDAGKSQSVKAFRKSGAKLKDQHMKKQWFALPVLAGVFVLSVTQATTITENFSANPLQNGWNIFGDTNLFRWDPTNQALDVTWDSTQTNSYFYHPLGVTVTRNDDFSIAFDLRLNDIASGVEPGKTGPMELGFGFLNFTNATGTNFMRGAYGNAPNVAEFDYYTSGYYDDGGIIYPAPATATPAFISGVDSYDYAPVDLSVYEYELPTNQWIHITLTYTATNQTAVLILTTNGVPVGNPPGLVLDSANGFSDSDDFQVDTFSISSYSSVGDDYDSVLAHGSVGNIVVTVPPPMQNLVGVFTNGLWQVRFTDRTNWLYTLQRTTDFQSWTNVSAATAGNGISLLLQDTNPPANGAFYRVSAERP